MGASRIIFFWLGGLSVLGFAIPALAWDPGVVDPVNPPPGVYSAPAYTPPAYNPQPYTPPPPRAVAPRQIVPARASAPPAQAAWAPPPPPPQPMMAPPPPAALAPIAPMQPAVQATTYYPPAGQQAEMVYEVQPVAPQPAMMVATSVTPVARARDESTIGLEGFYDIYKEPVVDLDNRIIYGSLTGSYLHYFDNNYFAGVDGRLSYGRERYKSQSGTASGINEWEIEPRLLGGYSVALGDGSRFEPYSGLGVRYYYDNGKGVVTSLNKVGYDRRLLQWYLPLGANYRFTSGGWNFKPNLEFDPVLFGDVQSRLQGTGIAGKLNVTNKQDPFTGYGIRAEMMMGPVNTDPDNFSWQFGPFVRYWSFQNSNPTTDTNGNSYIEPHNTRWQLGIKADLGF